MESLGLTELALIVTTSIGGAALIGLLGWIVTRYGRRAAVPMGRSVAPTFLFEGDDLVDATDEAQRMIRDAANHLSDRQALVSLFQDRFPTLDYVMSHMSHGDMQELEAADAADMSLRVEDIDGMIRITLLGMNGTDQKTLGETALQDGLMRELNFLRKIVDESPHLIWTQDAGGKLSWANAAYMRLSDRQNTTSDQPGQSWPQSAVFPDLHLDADSSGPVCRRTSVPFPDKPGDDWYDVTTIKLGKEAAHFAASAGAAVAAEQSKIKAMQTSGRLFGDLSTGLAIFDQKRRLAMFNPALTDLTGLQPSFLTMRPSLDTFLDSLREARMLPEPKDYVSWRDQFSALENEARAGTYSEMWELIDGQTFRVTGRPYADNSFVILFEDITAEVNLTRRFRTDIEVGQAVIDENRNAIAVFGTNGTLAMSNKAYADLWGGDHGESVFNHELRGEIIHWQQRCAAAPSWSDLRTFVSSGSGGEPWTDHLILEDGRHIPCHAKKIKHNKTMVTFMLEQDTERMRPVVHKLSLADPTMQGLKS